MRQHEPDNAFEYLLLYSGRRGIRLSTVRFEWRWRGVVSSLVCQTSCTTSKLSTPLMLPSGRPRWNKTSMHQEKFASLRTEAHLWMLGFLLPPPHWHISSTVDFLSVHRRFVQADLVI